MAPKDLANEAKKLKGVTVKIHTLAEIKKMKMGSFLSVARGSMSYPPYFIEIHYKPKTKAKKHIAIVGKGVTFDTGGYSLKPPKGMETMKCDMAGAAAVIGILKAVAKLQPKIAVSGYIAATENLVDSYAQRPGDVCVAMNGKSIEVLNTDAEGRLTLADALLYAQKKNPDIIIDMATLTGACMVALGNDISGLWSNDDKLADQLFAASQITDEPVWRMPLFEGYKSELKSPIADYKNIGTSPYGGAIQAALFLQNFIDEKQKWAHIDIAGPAFTSGPQPYGAKGGTGVMVRTICEFLSRQ